MGAECPNGHGRQRIVLNVTSDGKSPRRAHDIVARRLACGCVLPSGQFEAFQEAVGDVRTWAANEIMRIRRVETQKMGVAFKEYVMKEGEENAE